MNKKDTMKISRFKNSTVSKSSIKTFRGEH